MVFLLLYSNYIHYYVFGAYHQHYLKHQHKNFPFLTIQKVNKAIHMFEVIIKSKKQKTPPEAGLCGKCRDGKIRTCDLLVPNQAR